MRRSWRAIMLAIFLGLLVAVPAGVGHVSMPHGAWSEGDVGGKFGWSVATLESSAVSSWVVVGEPNAGAGRVHLFATTVGGGLGLDARFVLVGPEPASQFGHSVASAGDVDGDGADDLLVGAPLAAGLTGQPRAGRAYVYASGDGFAAPRLVIAGDVADARLGHALAGAADISGDARPDVLIGAPLSEGTRGAVFVVSAESLGTHRAGDVALAKVTGDAPADNLGAHGLAVAEGRWLAGVPLVGDNAGRAYLLEGARGGSVGATASITWEGAPDEELGFAVAFADARPVLAAPGADESAGRVHVMSEDGATRLSTFTGPEGARFGSSLAAGDFNGDAVTDLVAGAPLLREGTLSKGGAVHLPGPWPAGESAAEEIGAVLVGDVSSGRFGQSVAAVAAPGPLHPGGWFLGAPRGQPRAHLVVNLPPLPIAPVIEVPCDARETFVTLDASASTDPDGKSDIRSYLWHDAADDRVIAEGELPRVALPVGRYLIDLVVTDAFLEQRRQATVVAVVDEVAPSVTITRANEGEIWLEDEQPLPLTLPERPIGWATQIGLVTYEAEATDVCSDIERVEWYVDETLVAVDDAPPFQYEYDPHALFPVGERVRARAYDASENWREDCVWTLNAGWIGLHHAPFIGHGPPPVDDWNTPPEDLRDIVSEEARDCGDALRVPVVSRDVPVRL